MTAFYKYLLEFRTPNSPYFRDRTTETFYALDAEDLAEQFYKKYLNVDYQIIGKERIDIND